MKRIAANPHGSSRVMCPTQARLDPAKGVFSMRRHAVIAAVLALLPGAAALLATSSGAAPPNPQYSTRTDLVVLHVTVKDRRGAYVTDLPRAAFSVLEDGRPQTIQFFTSEDAPVTAGLIVDDSASMHPNRARVIAAATGFARSSNSLDEMFALAFNEDVRAALPAHAAFTSDGAVLTSALTATLNVRGRTALFDAIAQGLTYLSRGLYERKALVVISDGGDNASRTTFDEILTRTQASNALVYTVALVDPDGRGANPKVLKRIAEATGGQAYRPDDPREIARVLQEIAEDLRHTYTVGFVSSNPARDGAFRKLRVVVDAPGRRRLAVRTRSGYLASSDRGGEEAAGLSR
jgi:Ca-activated chloride channel family protein